jgi:FlaA1/EpsC-like NDP-sugar epimerase
MIRLSGCTLRDDDHPEGEIAITYTGLRPGEKLYEELLIQENDEITEHPLIRKAHEASLPPDRLDPLMEELEQALEHGDDQRLRQALEALVPEYRPLPKPVSGLRTSAGHPNGGSVIAGLPAG